MGHTYCGEYLTIPYHERVIRRPTQIGVDSRVDFSAAGMHFDLNCFKVRLLLAVPRAVLKFRWKQLAQMEVGQYE